MGRGLAHSSRLHQDGEGENRGLEQLVTLHLQAGRREQGKLSPLSPLHTVQHPSPGNGATQMVFPSQLISAR